MALHSLSPFLLLSLRSDTLAAVGVGIALLAGLAFINLGLLLPGLLSSRGGRHEERGGHVAFGPAAVPLISEPAPRWVASTKVEDADLAPAGGPTVASPSPEARPLHYRLAGSTVRPA